MKTTNKKQQLHTRSLSDGAEFLSSELVVFTSKVENRGAIETTHDIEYHFKIFQKQQIIAWMVLIPLGEELARLKTRFLCEEIDFPVSRKLYGHIENCAAGEGFRQLVVHATPAGKGFFQCLGYEELNQEVTESGVIMHKMKKALK
jgi:hypothetical protein